MHYYSGWTGAKPWCGTGGTKGVAVAFMTIDKKRVTCGGCQAKLVEWHRAFPMAHSEKLEGGAR